MGDAAARGRVSRRLPRSGMGPDARGTRLALPLAPLPSRVRRRAHQVARRSMLARSPLSLLPPRDAADAEPALVVLPPSPQAVAPHRGPGEPLRPAGRADPALLPPADRGGRRAGHRRHAVLAAAEPE